MADPLRRTLSKLRGKKSKRVPAAGEPGEDTALPRLSTQPQAAAPQPPGNRNNNNYSGLLQGSMTRERLGGSPGADGRLQRPVCPQDASPPCPRSPGCAPPGGRQQCTDTSLDQADRVRFTVTSGVLPPAHTCGSGMHPGHSPLSPACPALPAGKLQNGFARFQPCPQQRWDHARAFATELAASHPGQARQICARLEQHYRGSLQSQHSVDSEDDDYYDNDHLPYYEPELPAPHPEPLCAQRGPGAPAVRPAQEPWGQAGLNWGQGGPGSREQAGLSWGQGGPGSRGQAGLIWGQRCPASLGQDDLGSGQVGPRQDDLGWGQEAPGSPRQAELGWGQGGAPMKSSADSSQETDRLRTRLQEAYHLLIHAMQDMPGGRESPGSAERGPCSSPDSECSQSSLRAADSDRWSSGEASPQQVSDAECAGPGPGGLLRTQQCSRSLEAVCRAPGQPPLPRSLSDSGIQYSALPCRGPLRSAGHTWDCGLDSEEEDSPPQAAELQPVRWGQPAGTAGAQPCADNEGPGAPDSAGSASVMCSRADGPGGAHRSSGVTVRKMQKWMCKGRLLSLEMRERIIGSSLRAREEPPQGTVPVRLQAGGVPPGSPARDRRLLTDLIENVYASSVFRDEMQVVEPNEENEQRQQNNSITVSKKRNWLQQSTNKNSHKDGYDIFISIPEHVNQAPATLCPELQKPQIPARPPTELRGSVNPQVNSMTTTPSTLTNSLTVGNCVLDLSDDNDADDEGEIWYNPIPEDEEPNLLRGHCFSGIDSVRSDFQSINLQNKLSGRDLIKVSGHTASHPFSAECAGDSQTVPPSEINQSDSLHSSEQYMQLHKQRFACKARLGFNAEENPKCKSSETGPTILPVNKENSATEFSPPSSPNPLKKGGSINWSFPDKIKSPRTVRKLSMKMKKLPELSRKLSVKGTISHNCSDNSSSTKSSCQDARHASSLPSGSTAAASRNVISRYHLDSSVSSQQSYKKKSSENSKSSKGGYLSDGDSPELLTKSGKHGSENRSPKGKETLPINNNKTEIDIDAFRHYSFSDQPKCSHYISGLMSVHFYGAEDLKPPRMDTKDVFCAIQVDSVNKARTALLTCRTTFLDMDHTFNIELENAQHLKLVVFSWDPTPRKNRVCCHGTVVLPTLFRVTKLHQLAVKLEPRGLIYVKVTLMDQWENSFNSLGVNREPVMFGVEARKVVEKENVGLMVPLLMEKCIVEIEKRGCQVVGLYRLCGSAAVKKELREAFERDSKSVVLCENQYPDINVITGVLKDYLRELPSPLITKQLYEAVLNAMVRRPLKMYGNCNETDTSDFKYTVGLLDCLPDVEKATLNMLLDHLKLVASHHEVNKMTCQNLAVCFGPVLLSQRQETSNHNNRVFTDSEELASALDFKKHIEVLHYLLQMWPVQNSTSKESTHICTSPEQPYLRRKNQRPQMLKLSNLEMPGILRPRPARLDSPSSNRYAGDWSSCGESYFSNTKENMSEADYDDVPSEDTESGEDSIKVDQSENVIYHPKCTPKEHSFEAYMALQEMDLSLEPKVDLDDLQESIDNLIGSLERELSKNKINTSY